MLSPDWPRAPACARGRDADDALRLCDAEALEAALRELRRRIPAVAPPPAHGGLRDWDAREARVLAADAAGVYAESIGGDPPMQASAAVVATSQSKACARKCSACIPIGAIE